MVFRCRVKTWVVGVLVLILGVVGEARERTISSGLSYNQDERGVGRGRIVGQRQILYDHYGRRLRITPKECQSSSPRYTDLTGICMFNLECQEQSGTVIGACVDRFLFGACCHISDPVKRASILSGANINSSAEVTASALLSPNSGKNASKSGATKTHHVPAIRIPTPDEIHPTRFPLRSSWGSPNSGRIPSTPSSSSDSSSIPFGKLSVVPPPTNRAPFLPLTLETISNFRNPSSDRVSGGHDALRVKNEQSHESVEHETLGLGFVVTRDKHKPRPSSTKISVKANNSPPTFTSTPGPSKFSTFMYLDNDDSKLGTSTVKSVRSSTERNSVEVEDITASASAGNEELSSNTENVWSVMMQLGSEDKLLNMAGSKRPVSSSFAPTESVTSMMAEFMSSPDFKGDDDKEDDATRYPPLKFFGDVSPAQGLSSNPGDATDEEGGTTEREETTKPWASSTYYVHTFKYPNFTGGEDSTSDEQFDFVPTSSTMSTTTTPTPEPGSSTQPAIGKITTWSGIGSVVDKEQFKDKTTTNTPTATSTTTTSKPTTTKKATPAPTTTTTSTTKKPVPTEKWRKPAPYTLPPHKRPTTTEKEAPSSSEEEASDKESHDEVEDEVKVESKEEPTPTTKKPKPVAKTPVKKNSEKEVRQPTPSLSSSIILDEDMDTNLDDFVEQVVQGLAGSLDNLNIDNVILSANHDHSEHSADVPIDPLQVISDPSFPPFPIMGETLLTKPNVKNNPQQEKVGSSTTTEATTTSTTTTTQKPLDWRKDCGVRTQPKSGRIVGGTASKFGRWPWQALVKEATWLGLFSKNKCGGVLIAPKYVLTAAHCQPGFLATLTVVLGEFDISSHTEGGANSIVKNVRRVIVHRDYNAQTFENDIALLELDSAVDFKSHVVPICMPNDEEDFLGKKAFVTGWGRLKYGGGVPQILHEVDVPILKNDECQDMFHKSNHLKAIRDSFICAGYAEGFKDSCEGDSGGPLSIQRPNGQWVLAGTVSHGIKCAYPNLPGVYMRMTFYKPWIKRVTGIK